MPWIHQTIWEEEFFQATINIKWLGNSQIDLLRTLSHVFYKHDENIPQPTFIGLNIVSVVIHPNAQAESN